VLVFREMLPEDKAALVQALEGSKYYNSEFAFGNIYLWRQVWHIKICIEEGVVYLRGRSPYTGEHIYFQPAVPADYPIEKALEKIERQQAAEGLPFAIATANEEFILRLRKEDTAEQYAVEEDRDMFDYVYPSAALATLSGKKLHSKRNHVNRFVADHPDYACEMLTGASLEECLKVYDAWAEGRDENETRGERESIIDAITMLEELEMCGILIRVDGQPVAFTVGERFRPDMAVIHIEKALPDVAGAFSIVNYRFAQYWNEQGVTYINREEDMGLDGLRQAKLSYKPEFLVKKYDITKRA